ncbi:hypothetical protein ACFWPA_10965 [Rhodococcus sp. NPDC058505]|uniref:hypothetical protein n=1 Tax=unclassified Rhodococcus (in: high G+C Gram-positive bacteria) TaxID=192944 RepID=UPI0036544371
MTSPHGHIGIDHTRPASATRPRSATLHRPCTGARIADSAATRSSDTDLGHATFRTLEDAAESPLTDDQAASLGRLVRLVVRRTAGLPGGFDTVEDLCRGHLQARACAPTAEQTRAAAQRTLDRLRAPAS